jgi:L-alanine-DL-glutamate epimerase-like enolase superfamily enzyme
MYHCGNFWCRVGLGVSVLNGIEAALWDLKGKLLGQSVHALLGGSKHATIAAAHAGAACRNFLGLEYHFIETPWIGEYVCNDGSLFRDGHVVLTDAPGLGVELDREVCRKHLAPGETLFD